MQKDPSPKARATRSSDTGQFILGRERFERISVVEGITLTAEMRATREQFDRQGLSAAERRTAIIKQFVLSR